MQSDHKTLEELDGENWEEPETAPTPMVARCLRLRRTPSNALNHGDVRLLISQKIGLKYLIPKALELVCEDTLLEADMYPGDLLCALLRIDEGYWSQNPAELKWLVDVAGSVVEHYGKIVDDCERFVAANTMLN
jgi:CDI immunity proteins